MVSSLGFQPRNRSSILLGVTMIKSTTMLVSETMKSFVDGVVVLSVRLGA